jgi:hypothetical protein
MTNVSNNPKSNFVMAHPRNNNSRTRVPLGT